MLSWGRQPGLCVCGVCVYQRHIDSNAVWHENPAGFTAVTTQTSHLSLKCLIANLDWVFDAFSIICPHLYGKYTTRDRLQLIFIPRHSSMFLVLLLRTAPLHIDHQEIQAVFQKSAKALSQEVVAALSASWVWFASHLDSLCFHLGSSSSTSFFTCVNNTFTSWLDLGIKMSWIRLEKKTKTKQ